MVFKNSYIFEIYTEIFWDKVYDTWYFLQYNPRVGQAGGKLLVVEAWC